MSKSTSFGYTDTADGGATTQSFTRANLNWPTDFSIISDNDGKVILANKTSPLDQLERIRIESNGVADIYRGTSIDPSAYAPSRQGVSIVCQVMDVLRVTESTDATYQVDLPISAHIVVKVPLSTHVTAANVQAVLGRALSCFYSSNSTATTQIAAMLRGSMTPSGL